MSTKKAPHRRVPMATISSTSDNWTAFKGQTVTMKTRDRNGEVEITGELVSFNSKGANIKVDGKVISRKVSDDPNHAHVFITVADSAEPTVYTTAELAAIFDTNARALRVELRRLGLSVGKGRRYAFTSNDVANLRSALKAS